MGSLYLEWVQKTRLPSNTLVRKVTHHIILTVLFFFFKLLLLFTCKSIALLESEDPHNIMRSGNMWSLTVPTSKSQNSEWQNYTAVSQNEGKALQGWSEHSGLSPLVLRFAFLGR